MKWLLILVSLIGYNPGIVRIQTENSVGTAWAISDTEVLTAGHVCNKDKLAVLTTYDGRLIKAAILKVDEATDICLLKTNNKHGLKIFKISKGIPVRGARVKWIGAPLGLLYAVEHGYIMAITDTNIYSNNPVAPGVSGAPLINSQGLVIGMVQATTKIYNHITISIKAADILKFLEDN